MRIIQTALWDTHPGYKVSQGWPTCGFSIACGSEECSQVCVWGQGSVNLRSFVLRRPGGCCLRKTIGCGENWSSMGWWSQCYWSCWNLFGACCGVTVVVTASWEEPCTQHAGTCGTSHMRFSYFLVWTSWGQEAILNSHFSEFKSLQLSFYCLTIAKVKSFSLIINPECAFLHMEDPDSLLLTAWYFFSVLSCTINHCTQLSTLGNQKTIFNVNLGKPALVKKHVGFFLSPS